MTTSEKETMSGPTGRTTTMQSSTTIAATVISETLSNTTTTGFVVVMSGTQTSNDDNTALIGGVVGGIVALLIVVGLIACVVVRNRQTKHSSFESSPNQTPMAPPASASNYGNIGVVHSQYTSIANKDTGYEMGNLGIQS